MRSRQWIGFVIGLGVLGSVWAMGLLLESNINEYVVRVIINCGIGTILAMSLNLVNGCAGQFSLGHAGFMGIGAYSSATLTTILGFSFFQSGIGIGCAVIVGGICAGVTGYLVGLPSLRLRGDYLAIVTLGFGEIIRIIFLNIPAIGGPRGLTVGADFPHQFFWVYVAVVVTFILLLRFIRSSHGRAILALREDEIAAQAMGVDVAHYKVVAFVISSFFAGIAGGLFAHFQGFIDPNSFNFNRSVEVVIMVVMGGMGSLSGSMIGGIVVTLLPEVLRIFEQYRMVIFSALLVAFMLLRPRGLLGRHEIWELLFFFRKKGKGVIIP